MIGPYFNVAYTPDPNDAWRWTAAHELSLRCCPAAWCSLGGVLLIISAKSEVRSSVARWPPRAARG